MHRLILPWEERRRVEDEEFSLYSTICLLTLAISYINDFGKQSVHKTLPLLQRYLGIFLPKPKCFCWCLWYETLEKFLWYLVQYCLRRRSDVDYHLTCQYAKLWWRSLLVEADDIASNLRVYIHGILWKGNLGINSLQIMFGGLLGNRCGD